MASARKSEEPKKPRRPAAKTPEGREKQLISLAVDLAEKQLREGTASSQTINSYLKLGSTRERLEQQRLVREVELLEKKSEAIESAKRVEAMYETALGAMRMYQGQEPSLSETYDD